MKYKIWDKNKKVWIDDGLVVNMSGQICSINDTCINETDYLTLRWLGLRDRYSADLYNNDIVEVFLRNNIVHMEIVFHPRFGALFVNSKEQIPIDDNYVIRTDGEHSEIEVIDIIKKGNRWSNPQMLNFID